MSLSLFTLRRVVGESMSPALRPGQIVIGATKFKKLRPGDVVIVRHGGVEKIKRLSLVAENKLFVVGDNQPHSTDSRSFGWLPLQAALAKIVWPATGSGPA